MRRTVAESSRRYDTSFSVENLRFLQFLRFALLSISVKAALVFRGIGRSRLPSSSNLRGSTNAYGEKKISLGGVSYRKTYTADYTRQATYSLYLEDIEQ